eukprot:6420645-Alexandrium_andersonii.AAC.1
MARPAHRLNPTCTGIANMLAPGESWGPPSPGPGREGVHDLHWHALQERRRPPREASGRAQGRTENGACDALRA